jgi:hypothetical protein
MKKRLVLVALLLLTLAVLSPGLAQAQGELSVLDSWAEADFPMRMNFNLSARSNFDITDIRLCYSVDRTSFADVFTEVSVDFIPGTTVDASFSLEMVMVGGLPPGSSLDYWWKLEDAGGGQLETRPARVRFDDTRYDWDSLTQGQITIYCYQDDEDFVNELMAAAQEALARLSEDTGAVLEKPAQLYIYASSADLQGAMIHPQEWTGGVAYTRHGIIAIGISPTCPPGWTKGWPDTPRGRYHRRTPTRWRRRLITAALSRCRAFAAPFPLIRTWPPSVMPRATAWWNTLLVATDNPKCWNY